MDKRLLTGILGILLISLASATININSGENYSFESEEFEYYNVVGNSSNLNGMNITWKNGHTTISLNKYFASDNFTLTFFNSKDEVINEYSGGGWRCTYNKDFDWNCSEWSECINGTQTRICKEYNNCRGIYGKPNLTQSCLMPVIKNDTDTDDEPEPIENNFTWLYLLCGFLVGVVLILFFKLFKKKEEKKDEEKSEEKIKK